MINENLYGTLGAEYWAKRHSEEAEKAKKELEQLRKNPPTLEQFKAAHDLFKYTDDQLYQQWVEKIESIVKKPSQTKDFSVRDVLINELYYLTWMQGSDT